MEKEKGVEILLIYTADSLIGKTIGGRFTESYRFNSCSKSQ